MRRLILSFLSIHAFLATSNDDGSGASPDWVEIFKCNSETGEYYIPLDITQDMIKQMAIWAKQVRIVDKMDGSKGVLSAETDVFSRLRDGLPLSQENCDLKCVKESWTNVGKNDMRPNLVSYDNCDYDEDPSYPETVYDARCNNKGLHIGLGEAGNCHWSTKDEKKGIKSEIVVSLYVDLSAVDGVCQSDKSWRDVNGDDCQWYEEAGSQFCGQHDSALIKSAFDACCACKNWNTLRDTQCTNSFMREDGGRIVKYNNRQEALEQCAIRKGECGGVFSQACSPSGPYMLCKPQNDRAQWRESEEHSCIWVPAPEVLPTGYGSFQKHAAEIGDLAIYLPMESLYHPQMLDILANYGTDVYSISGINYKIALTAGVFGNAFKFTNKDSKVEILTVGNNQDGPAINENNFSVSLWLSMEGDMNNNAGGGVFYISTGGHERAIYVDSDGRVHTRTFPWGKSNPAPDIDIKDYLWHHIVYSVTEKGEYFWLDGERMMFRATRGARPTDPYFFEDVMSIGWDEEQMYFKGSIDEVMVFSKGVTDEDVLSLYRTKYGKAAGITPTPTTLAQEEMTSQYGAELWLDSPRKLAQLGPYKAAPGQFGHQNYGGSVTGQLVFSPDWDPKDSKSEETLCHDPVGSVPRGKKPFVMFIKRGTCFFVDKVKRAQDLGASAVIIWDAQQENLFTMWPSEDYEALGKDHITIPAILIQNNAGLAIKDVMMNTGNFVPKTVTLRWGLPHPSGKVDLHYYTCSEDKDSADFKKNFKWVLDEMGSQLNLDVHYFIKDGRRNGCTKDPDKSGCKGKCVNQGRYCTPVTITDETKMTGVDFLQEDLRQMCLWDYEGKGKDQVSTSGADVWFDYVNAFEESCTGSFSNPKVDEAKFRKDCSDNILVQMGGTHTNLAQYVEQCVVDSGFAHTDSRANSEFEEDLNYISQHGIWSCPTVVINEFKVMGGFECKADKNGEVDIDQCQIFKAICSAFAPGTAPVACGQHLGCNEGLVRDKCNLCLPQDDPLRDKLCKDCDGIMNGSKSIYECGDSITVCATPETYVQKCKDKRNEACYWDNYDACGRCWDPEAYDYIPLQPGKPFDLYTCNGKEYCKDSNPCQTTPEPSNSRSTPRPTTPKPTTPRPTYRGETPKPTKRVDPTRKPFSSPDMKPTDNRNPSGKNTDDTDHDVNDGSGGGMSGGVIAILILLPLLIIGGGAGYWYFYLRSGSKGLSFGLGKTSNFTTELMNVDAGYAGMAGEETTRIESHNL